ncbi:MAG TPA: WXG100 family type VII secretion target [Actinophytocola sp.]|uniref:WXG100 family type VII secretion target n=1 Tax=Actinophytocola sp. TaxID=1872138 RepID=UPI002DDD695E|nr:WXG100 family type VII secretion target [Actinophytocola sp.]HEV2780833.1 WXG100 family type VII secretion target [Actinophytocola sp.]
MADWKTNEDLALIAHRLGTAVVAMYEKGGFPISVPAYPGGAPTPDARQTFVNSFVEDAEDFMSLEPRKIYDEYARMEQEGSALRDLGSTQGGALENANARLAANWHGDAAEAFAAQMFHIQRFIDQQRDRTLQAAQAMGTLYRLAIEARRSYHNLAEATIVACEKEMADQDDRDTKAQVGMLGELVKTGVNLFDVKKVGELVGKGIDNFTEMGVTMVDIALDGSEAPAVVESYIRGRNELRESFDSGLTELTKWIKLQDSLYREEPMPILEPLPAYLDISGPDFRYDRFEHEDRPPDSYGPRVEQERAEIAEEERTAGDSEIGRRLGGDKGPV